MKKIIFFFLLIISVHCLYAQEGNSRRNFGLGIILGEPSGIVFKSHLSGGNDIDGAFAFSPNNKVRVHVDYLWNATPFNASDNQVGLYYGVGGVLGFGSTNSYSSNSNRLFISSNTDFGVGLRAPLGLDYFIPKSFFEIFVEIAPILVFSTGSGIVFDAGLGARYYF